MATDPGEHLVIYEPDQAQRALDLLLWQMKGKPRIDAFMRALAIGAQLLEDTSWAVIAGGSVLDAAQGETLSRWGEIFGEVRGALSTEQYRKFIDLRIQVNTTFCNSDTMYDVILRAVDPSTVFSSIVSDGIIYTVTSPTFISDELKSHTAGLVRDYRPVGFWIPVVEIEADGAWIGSIAVPGSTIGSIASPGAALIGRLIYSGRG